MSKSRRTNRRAPGIKEKPEFEQQLVDLARVTRVVKGGKRLSFRACMVIGDRKGRVGIGVGKGKDVAIAIGKAVRQAQKEIIKVSLVNGSIPHWIKARYKASTVLFRPTSPGTGIVAGGVVRIILKLAGVDNVTAKMLKSKNKINNAKASIKALQLLSQDDMIKQ